MNYYSGRHGSIPSSEIEHLIVGNSQFCTVLRAGAGDGQAGIVDSITGKYILGLGGGRIPEWSYMRDTEPRLVRGWRNILYELLHRRRLKATKKVARFIGTDIMNGVLDYGMSGQPMESHEPTKVYMDGTWASGL